MKKAVPYLEAKPQAKEDLFRTMDNLCPWHSIFKLKFLI